MTQIEISYWDNCFPVSYLSLSYSLFEGGRERERDENNNLEIFHPSFFSIFS